MNKPLLLIISFYILLLLNSCSTQYQDEEALTASEEKFTALTWNETNINTAESPQWCLSRSNNWVALTNYNEKKQYYIKWDGGMSKGIKKNPIFKISTNGESPKDQSIKSMELHSDGIYCTITFTGENGESGVFIFPLSGE